MDAARYYTEHVNEINEAIGVICRRHSLYGEEAKDFSQHVHLQLIENDYRRIRAYKGPGSLKTYLYTVISRIFIDQVRVKWHPSAEAKRMGAAAVELEKLVFRHHYAVHEACHIMAADPVTAMDENEARETLERLTLRSPRPTLVADPEEHLPAFPDPAPDPEQRIADRQLQHKRRKLTALVSEVIAALSPEDRLLIKLRFLNGNRMPEIARLLGTDDLSLYRRTRSILRGMRAAMQEAGVGEQDIREIFAAEAPDD